jgi:hypothetical protein
VAPTYSPIPKAPYRCPPGPYERASQIAWYFKTHKPGSKVIVLDANDKVISKEKLFLGVWENDYKGILEYRPGWNVVAVDALTNIVTSELGDKERGEVLNLLPPQRAADIARIAGVVNVNDRWADVDWISLESTAVNNITCPWRRPPGRALDAQVGAHGQPARQGGCRRDCRNSLRPRTTTHPDGQHLLLVG